ncbi:MAG: SpaA isopeptide-forming pilin-related protein, partial [Candidatus Limisoma sp.]
MKRLFTTIALVAMMAASAMAGKSAEEVRIYLNPGHGSWGPNNRPCNTIGRPAYTSADPDTTGFYESNTNLRKVLSTLDCLVDAGVPFDRTLNQTNENPARVGAALDLSQHIVMSHVKVGPYPYTGTADDSNNAYNRPLSEIAEEVEANNFDIFISVHSNAASEGATTNYPLYLYRGTDAEASAAGSKEIATHIWPYSYSNAHMNWTHYSTSTNIRGDISFYGSSSDLNNNGTTYTGYLGVLKHGVPGFLVEGYFHTYQPARQRAMNFDVDRHEGRLYARGLVDYMGWTAQSTGEIYGIVRDLHEKFTDPLYSPIARTNDVYKPLNGVVVDLYKGDTKVASYTTDNEYNGAFLFTGLEPGTYSLQYSAEGYKPATEEYTATFEVKANETVYPAAFLESESYVPDEIVYVNYPDEIEGNPLFGLASEYNLSASESANALSEQLAGKTIRRQIVRNGVLYVLALDEAKEPYIYTLDIATGTTGTISTEGTTLGENRSLKLADITFTADNVLVGCSYGKNQYSDGVADGDGEVRGYVNVYKWENSAEGVPTGSPALWFSNLHSGNYNRAYAGNTIAYSGDSQNGSLIMTFETTGTTQSLRFSEFAIADGSCAGVSYMNKDISENSNWTVPKLGADYSLIVSPRDEEQYIIDGSNTNPTEWHIVAQAVDAPLLGSISDELLNAATNGASCFKYAGRSLMVAPIVADGKASGVKLFDITDGLDAAKVIATNSTIDPIDAVVVSAAGRAVYTKNNEDAITAANIELYLVNDGQVTTFTTAGVEQPVFKGEYAYGLQTQENGATTTLSFNLSGDATDVKVVITNSENVEKVINLGALEEGANSTDVDNAELGNGMFDWKVVVDAQTIPGISKIASVPFARTRGVAVDKSGTSPYQGSIYVGVVTGDENHACGVYRLDKDFNITTETIGADEFVASHTASPFRLDVLPDGTVLACDWSDAHSGIHAINPNDLSVSQFFAGERQSDGSFVYNGATIGGSTTCATVVGKGANTQLYVFNEDINNVISRYDIGTANKIDFAPNAT